MEHEHESSKEEIIKAEVAGLGERVLQARRQYDSELEGLSRKYKKKSEPYEIEERLARQYNEYVLPRLVEESAGSIQRILGEYDQELLSEKELRDKLSKYGEVIFGVPEKQKGEEFETSKGVRGLINAAISRPVMSFAKATVTGLAAYTLFELAYAGSKTVDFFSNHPIANVTKEFAERTLTNEVFTPHYTAPGVPWILATAVPAWALATGLWIWKGRKKSRTWRSALENRIGNEVSAHTDSFASDISEGILTEKDRYDRKITERIKQKI